MTGWTVRQWLCESPSLGFALNKVEGDLDRGLWWTLLTTAWHASTNKALTSGQPHALVEMGLLVLDPEEGRLRPDVYPSIHPRTYSVTRARCWLHNGRRTVLPSWEWQSTEEALGCPLLIAFLFLLPQCFTDEFIVFYWISCRQKNWNELALSLSTNLLLTGIYETLNSCSSFRI